MRTWLFAGAVNGFVAVAAGAFAAHGLKASLGPDALGWFETGARYQALHALALLAVAGLAADSSCRARTAIAIAGWSYTIGIVLFCGSLYLLAITGWRGLGAVTPLGGLGFLTGWGALAWIGLSRSK